MTLTNSSIKLFSTTYLVYASMVALCFESSHFPSLSLFFMIWVRILWVRKTFRLDMRISKALALDIGFLMTTFLTFKPLNLKALPSPRDKSLWCSQMNYKKEITNEDNFIFFLLLMKTSLRIMHSQYLHPKVQGFAITTRWQFTRSSRESQLARS